MNQRRFNICALALVALVLAGCSGGSGTPAPPPPPPEAPSIKYPSTTLTFATQYDNTVTPSNTGGIAQSWSIAPALPAGLTFSTTTGSITSATAAVAAPASYVVTAQNSGGQSSTTLTIQVVSGVLLDLGHGDLITSVQLSGTRALSEDFNRHWVLWDTSTETALTSGQLDCTAGSCTAAVVIAGPTMAIPLLNPQRLTIRATSDGHVTATITANYDWLTVAVDGSYVVAGGSGGLQAWSPTGEMLYTAAGSYGSARVYPAPGQIQVALGAAGTNVIETVTLASGTSSLGPTFQGQFGEWFDDGSHFQTSLGATLWTYSNQSVQQDLTNPSPVQVGGQSLAGAGNWFWVATGSNVNIYRVGASATPAATIPGSPVFVSGLTLGIQNGTTLTIEDLSGASLSSAVSPLLLPSGVLAASASEWFAAGGVGVLLHATSQTNTPKALTLGQAWSLAANGGRAAVGVASGTIFVIDPQTKVVQLSIPDTLPASGSAAKIEMSSDGSVLAVLGQPSGNPAAAALTIYSLPSGAVINTWTNPAPYDFSLAPSGTRIAVLQSSGAAAITAINGGPVLLSPVSWYPERDAGLFSPDATGFAVSIFDVNNPLNCNAVTYVYQNSALTTTVPGIATGWLDNGRLLVANYTQGSVTQCHSTDQTTYSPTGAVLPTPPVPLLGLFQNVTTATVYVRDVNSIYSISTGALVFGDSLTGVTLGAATPGYAVFNSGAFILAVPY